MRMGRELSQRHEDEEDDEEEAIRQQPDEG